MDRFPDLKADKDEVQKSIAGKNYAFFKLF